MLTILTYSATRIIFTFEALPLYCRQCDSSLEVTLLWFGKGSLGFVEEGGVELALCSQVSSIELHCVEVMPSISVSTR